LLPSRQSFFTVAATIAPLESVMPSPSTLFPPRATSLQLMSVKRVLLVVFTRLPPAVNVSAGHVPLTFVTVPSKL